MAQSDQLKWNLPGWRIEQRYAPRVLIGNWAEERYAFQKGNYNHTSTQRMDFAKYPGYRPDVMTRRAAMLRGEGLNNKLLFSHHNGEHTENLVSWYDEHYNKKERSANDMLPESRHWDANRLAWEPEASDHPIKGHPTNFGLRESMQKKWEKEAAAGSLGEYHTTYGTSFKDLPSSSLVTRHYSPPKALSTRMHPANKINKDLSLRSVNVIQTPEQVVIPTASRLASKEGSRAAIPDVSI